MSGQNSHVLHNSGYSSVKKLPFYERGWPFTVHDFIVRSTRLISGTSVPFTSPTGLLQGKFSMSNQKSRVTTEDIHP